VTLLSRYWFWVRHSRYCSLDSTWHSPSTHSNPPTEPPGVTYRPKPVLSILCTSHSPLSFLSLTDGLKEFCQHYYRMVFDFGSECLVGKVYAREAPACGLPRFFACHSHPRCCGGLLCPSSDLALQDVEDPTDTRSRILTLSSISTS
jgi:hypothetical protein